MTTKLAALVSVLLVLLSGVTEIAAQDPCFAAEDCMGMLVGGAPGTDECCNILGGISFMQDATTCFNCAGTTVTLLGVSPVDTVEGDTLNLQFIFSALDNDGPASMVDPITVDINLDVDGLDTAQSTIDFNIADLSPMTNPTSNPGDNMLTIPITIETDNFLEEPEFFTFNLSSSTPDITLIANSFRVNIVDDPSFASFTLEIVDGFTAVDNLFLENSTEGVIFCANITGPDDLQSSIDVVVFIEVTGDLEPEDIRILRDNITIPSGSLGECEPLFDIIDDENYEFIEVFNVSITGTSVDSMPCTTLTFGVVDPEDAVIEFDRAVYLVEEGNCFMPAVRVTTPDLNNDMVHGIGLQCITVTANVLPGEGKAGAGEDDINGTSLTFDLPLNFANGDVFLSNEEICLLNNFELHGNLTFTLQLVPFPIVFELGQISIATVVFKDNEGDGPALVLITATQSNVDEGFTFDLHAEVIFAGNIRNLTVHFPLVPKFHLKRDGFLPAEAADIVNLDQLYFNFECFTEGETAYIFDILAQGNDCLEGPETIGFTLGESSNVPGAMAFGNTVEIVINDAEALSATLSVSSPLSISVDECEDNFVEVCVEVTTTCIGNPFTVELIVWTGTTAVLGDDFELGIVPPEGCPLSPFNFGPVPPNAPAGPEPTATSLLINFEAGSDLEACSFVSILNDNVYEAEEQITLAISASSPFFVNIGSPFAATIIINKDIKDAVLSLSTANIFNVAEGNFLQICFVLVTEGNTECSIDALLLPDPDVSFVSDTITFLIGSTSGDVECFNVSIEDDDLLEGKEVLLLEAFSEDAIISSLFDSIFDVIDAIANGIGGAIGDLGDAIYDCIEEVGGGLEDIIKCLKRLIGHVPYSDIHRNSTLIPLVIADANTEGVSVSFDSMSMMDNEANGDVSVPVSLVGLGGTQLVTDVAVCILVTEAKSGALYKHTVIIMAGTQTTDLVIPIIDDDVFGPTKVFTATIESSDPSLEIGPIGMTTIMVEDNDVATVSLVSESVTVCEGDPEGVPAGQVCVALSSPADGIACDITITLSFTEVTALSPGDFDDDPLSLTIAAAIMPDTPVCFDVQTIVNDDYVIEGTESFLVQKMSVSPPEVMIVPGQTEVFIEDKDVTKVGFQDLEVELVEGGDTYINLTFDRTLEKPIVVSYSLMDIVDSGNNEPPQAGSLVIGENAASDNPIMSGVFLFDITVGPDPFKEAIEVFALGLQSDDECVCLGRDLSLAITPANGGVDVFITAPPHIQVNESDGVVKICVEVNLPIQSTFEILLSTVDITATGGEDFEAIVEKSLVFAPGFGLIRCVHIPILPDDCLEQLESFNVTLSADHIGVQFTNDEVTVYIIEDDVTKVGFEELEYTQVEGESTLVCITFDKKLEKEIIVKYFLENSTALNFENNEPAQCGVLVIGGEASPENPLLSGTVCFNVSVGVDLFKEGIELFTLSLESNDPCVWLGRDRALLNVQENGVVTVGITADVHLLVNESAGFVKICVEADHASQTTYEIVFRTVDGTATAGEDYVGVVKSLLFALGFDLVQCVHIPILPDDCIEVMELFDVELSADHIGVQFDVQQITVYILEDDVAKVGFEEQTYTIEEGVNMEVCVTFDKKLEKPLSVEYFLNNVSPFGTNEEMQSGNLVIGASASPQNPVLSGEFCFDINVPEDMIKEGRETFTLTLESNDDCVCLGRDGALVFVEPNEEVTVSVMSATHIQVTESSGFVKVCLQADHASQATFQVTLISQDVTAIDGEDYIGLNKSLVFAFGFGVVQCVHIPILDDECYEDFMQSFNIMLSSDHERVLFEVDVFPVYILDDDFVYVSFEESFLYLEEDVGVVTICVELRNVTGETKDPLNVEVFSEDGTAMAQAPSDYESVDATVTFPAGSVTGSRIYFTITIVDNFAFEKIEIFSVHIRKVGGMVAGNVFVHTRYILIHIRDDDLVYVSFRDSEIYVNEGQVVQSVCLELRNVTESTQAQIWANVSSGPGTAMVVSDFTEVAATVIFPPNSMDGSYECFDVFITDDMAFEKIEFFYVHIIAVEVNVEIHIAWLTIFIHDDDIVYVSFRDSEISVDESQMSLDVCVELRNVSEPTQAQIWADVSSMAGSAMSGSDFTDVVTTVTFPPNSVDGNSSCFPVLISNNMAFEKVEYFTLCIVAVEDNVVIHIIYLKIFILDDDPVSLLFTEDEYFVTEQMLMATVCLVLSGADAPTQAAIWANVSTSDLTATEISGDYIGVDVSLSLDAGSTNGDMICQDISVLDDGIVEDQESFLVQAVLEEGVIPPIDNATVVIGVCDPMFIGDTPRVDGAFVTVLLSDCVEQATCAFPNQSPVPCAGGETVILIPTNTRQTLTVTIASLGVILERTVRRDNTQCDSHLVNSGITKLMNGNYLLEFEGTGPDPEGVDEGPITTFNCLVSPGPGAEDCSPPSYEFSLPSGTTDFSVVVDPDPADHDPDFECSRMHTRTYSGTSGS